VSVAGAKEHPPDRRPGTLQRAVVVRVPPAPHQGRARFLLMPIVLATVALAPDEAGDALARERREEAAARGEQPVFSYTDASGRAVYVDDLVRVPPRLRASARRVDLSRVSLNTEVGRELARQVERERERQAAGAERGGRCGGERGAAAWLRSAWEDHGHLILIGALILALAVATPFLVRYISGERWVRILLVAVPLLASLAILSVAASRTSVALRSLRAARCEPGAGDAGALRPRLDPITPALRKVESTLRKVEREQRVPRDPSCPAGWVCAPR
jgi:hypothetical protein